MEIRVEAHGPHVAVVTIDNQPRRNAMTRQMMAELAAQWDALARASYRCITRRWFIARRATTTMIAAWGSASASCRRMCVRSGR